MPLSSYQRRGSTIVSCSSMGLPRASSVPAVKTLTPGDSALGGTKRLWLCEMVGPMGCRPPNSFSGHLANSWMVQPGGVSLPMFS